MLTNEKHFPKTKSQWQFMVCLYIYKFTENYCRSRLLSKFIQTQKKYPSYLSWQNTYPNLKTTCHIKLKFFLWTKVKENLLLAKYVVSATAPLTLFA